MDATWGEQGGVHPQDVGPSRPDVPFLEAGPHGAVRPLRDDTAKGAASTGENPVRVPGRGSRPGARVRFGATFVAKVPSWKAENAKMTFSGKSKIQSPRKETVWVQLPEEKEEPEPHSAGRGNN